MSYIIIDWPDSQELLSAAGFKEHSCLINDGPLFEKHGSSAYFVDVNWYNEFCDQKEEIRTFTFKKMIKHTIWTEEFFEIDCTTQEEGLAELTGDPEEIGYDAEYMYDTATAMTPEQNGGNSTIEIYDEDDIKIWKNGK